MGGLGLNPLPWIFVLSQVPMTSQQYFLLFYLPTYLPTFDFIAQKDLCAFQRFIMQPIYPHLISEHTWSTSSCFWCRQISIVCLTMSTSYFSVFLDARLCIFNKVSWVFCLDFYAYIVYTVRMACTMILGHRLWECIRFDGIRYTLSGIRQIHGYRPSAERSHYLLICYFKPLWMDFLFSKQSSKFF